MPVNSVGLGPYPSSQPSTQNSPTAPGARNEEGQIAVHDSGLGPDAQPDNSKDRLAYMIGATALHAVEYVANAAQQLGEYWAFLLAQGVVQPQEQLGTPDISTRITALTATAARQRLIDGFIVLDALVNADGSPLDPKRMVQLLEW